jgi:S1-C subfamily serine protease
MFKHLACAVALLAFVASGLGWAQESQEARARASLGVAVEPTPKDALHPGLIIRDLRPQGPAAKAGLEVGDVITKADDQALRTYEDLVNFIAKHKPSDKVTFHFIHEGKEQTKSVTLGERPMRALQPGAPGRRAAAFLGITPSNVKEGVVVTEVVPDSPAAKAGLQSGDVITRFNDKDVSDEQQLRQMIRDAGVGNQVAFTVMHGNEKKDLKATLVQAPAEFGVGRAPMPRYGEPLFNPPVLQDLQKIPHLERRIEQLERRIKELEQKIGQTRRTPESAK